MFATFLMVAVSSGGLKLVDQGSVEQRTSAPNLSFNFAESVK